MKTKRESLIFFVISVLWLVYFGLRAAFVPFFHDEAATFFHYIQQGEFIPFLAHHDANNHPLNSAFGTVMYRIFGKIEFFLRLPNLLFGAIYLFFIYKLSRFLKNNFVRWSFIVVLLFIHNFSEFFGFCRGYGISFASLTGAIYFTYLFIKNHKTKHLLLFALFNFLGLFSNFNLIYSSGILLFLIVINLIIHRKEFPVSYKLSAWLISIILALIPFITAVGILLNYSKSGLLYTGLPDGFWVVSVKTVLKLLLESQHFVTDIFVVFLFALACFSAVFVFRKEKRNIFSNLPTIVFFLLVGNILAIVSAHYILDVNYPDERIALHLFLFLIMSVFFYTDYLQQILNRKWIKLLLIPTFIFPVHFIFNINLSHSALWKFERIPERFAKTVYEKTKGSQYTVGGYVIHSLIWSWYGFKEEITLSRMQNSYFAEDIYDFQVIVKEYLEEDLKKYMVLDYDEISNLSLLERKEKLPHNKILFKQGFKKLESENSKFVNLYKLKNDTLTGKNLIFRFDLSVSSNEKTLDTRIVVTTIDSVYNNIQYEDIPFNWTTSDFNGETKNIKNYIILTDIHQDCEELLIYLWNRKQQAFCVESGNVTCEILERE